jgi:site-specific DNA-methyltransferase (cytosine-N4-specific)
VVGSQQHPARFPAKLPEFFIRFLTDEDDLVVDIFAGSNTTGAVAEVERRRWLAFDLSLEYLAASSFRFIDSDTTESTMRDIYARLLRNESLDMTEFVRQGVLLETPTAITGVSRR